MVTIACGYILCHFLKLCLTFFYLSLQIVNISLQNEINI
jgi:hypothetical protein